RWDGWTPFETVNRLSDLRLAERRLLRRGRPGWLVSSLDTCLWAFSGSVWERGGHLREICDWMAAGGASGRLVNVPPRVAARYAEWPGYRWQRPEEIVDCCLRRGLVPLPIAVFTPRWAGAGQANSPPDPGLFADFVSAAAARFRGRVELWELWNEPNLRRYWNGPLADYACGPLRRGAEALRALDPAIRVVLGGLAQGHGIAEVLAHDRESFDIASLHYYPPRRLAGLRARPEWEVGAFRDALRAAHLGSVPVWLTDVGGLAAPSRPTGDGGPVT